MDEPGPAVVDELVEKHAGHAYGAASDANIPHTTVVESNIKNE